MALWGKKRVSPNGDEENPQLGMGPDYFAPETTSPADTYSPPNPGSGTETIQQQWSRLDHDMLPYPGEMERIRRSRTQERYNYAGGGPYVFEQDKGVRPDTSYYNPPKNPRRVRTPSTVSFEHTPFGHGFAKRLNGNHESFAQHAEVYQLFGQAATAVPRLNTNRIEPAPADVNVVDIGDAANPVWGVFQNAEVPSYPRSFRLG